MARINIDDQFWIDLLGVVAKVHDQDKAIGQVVRFFRMAQEKHKNGRLIEEDEFARAGFDEALIGPFADRVDGGIQAVGAQKHFGWLAKRVEAGRKGGKQTQAKSSKRKQPEASSSYSPSSSSSPSNSNSFLNTLPTTSSPAPNAVKIYCDLWKSKNGKSPDIRPKEAGQLTKLAKDVGISRASEIMEAYFSMPDPVYMKRGYDVGTMLLNLAAISQFEVHHKIVTSEAVKQIEKQVDKAQGTKRRRSIADLEAERDSQRGAQLLKGGDDDSAA